MYTEIVARGVAKYKLNCVANGAFDVERTTALTKIGFAFKYYFRHEMRKAKIHCPTGREIKQCTVTIIDRCSVRVIWTNEPIFPPTAAAIENDRLK
jgi:hypothetical protein